MSYQEGPLDSGGLYPARNDEDLGQSALTEAHGDHVVVQTSNWEIHIRKRRLFLMHD